MDKTELRLVHTEQGTSAAAYDPRAAGRLIAYKLAGMMVCLLPFVLAFPLIVAMPSGRDWILGGMGMLSGVAVMAWMVGTLYEDYQHIRIGPRALHLRRLRGRVYQIKALPIEQIRSGEDSPRLLGAPSSARVFPYAEITAMGFTDYSLWFDVNGAREEVILESVSRVDIERLFEALEPVWQRARAGITDSPAEAEAARRSLGALNRAQRGAE